MRRNTKKQGNTTPEEDNFLSKTLVFHCFLVFCRIGEYISLDLFYFVNLTGSCSLIPCILPVNTVPYYGGLIETCQNVNVGGGGLELSSESSLVTRMILQPFTAWINRSPFLWPPFFVCKGGIDGDMTSKGRWNPLPWAGT